MAFGESIRLCRVYEKTSAKGNTYMTGRLAGAKVAILKSRDVADDGSPIWDIVLSQAPDRNAVQSNVVIGAEAPVASGNGHKPSFDRQLDDEIPF